MIVHLNGELVPLVEAKISPLDRGFIFADGVYEGLRSVPGAGGPRIVGSGAHTERMREGLAFCGIEWDVNQLDRLAVELVKANGLVDAFVYWQVTRGAPGEGDPPRRRVPAGGMRPTVFGFCYEQPGLETYTEPKTKTVITRKDPRWLLGRIKSISLHGNVVCAMGAAKAGCDDAVLLRDGLVAEATATNVILAVPDGSGGTELVTPSLESVPILAGVTRSQLLDIVPGIRERAVRAEELREAAEVMLVGTTTMVESVVRIDGRQVGDGAPGPRARELLSALIGAIREGA